MNIVEIKRAQKELNETIDTAVRDFEQRTGTLVNSVNVEHINVRSFDDWNYSLLPIETEILIK